VDSAFHIPAMTSVPVTDASDRAPSATELLTRKLLAGEESAWVEFHAAYASRLLRYLLVVCAGREDTAREVLQQTLLRAVKYMRIITTEPELWSWLTVLARTAAVDNIRREHRYLGFLTRWGRESSQPFPPSVEGQGEVELEAALSVVWEELPAEDRNLLERKYLDGVSIRAMAASLETSEKAVESRLTRARLRLKSAILSRLRHE
jgi:RNA polymerase sigma-70 factor (ECF subfamily)